MGNLDHHFSILVPDGEHYYLRTIVNCLSNKKNLKIYVMSNKRNVPMRHSRFVHHFSYYPEATDYREWIENINTEIVKYSIDLILPVFEDAMLTLIKHKKLLNNPDKLPILPSHENYLIANDKRLLARHLENNGIQTPLTVQIYGDKRSKVAIKSLGFPMLAKLGTCTGGGRGIQKIRNQENLDAFLSVHPSSSYIFQKYIEGEDVGCNVLCKNGSVLAYTIQKGFLWGSKAFSPQIGLEFIHEEQVLSIAKKLMRSLDWSGVANIDFLFDRKESSFKVLEVNPRYWATIEASLIAGVNFPYLHCLTSLKKSFELPEYALIRYFSTNGILVAARKNVRLLTRPNYIWKNTPLQFALKDPKATCYHYFWAMKNAWLQKNNRH